MSAIAGVIIYALVCWGVVNGSFRLVGHSRRGQVAIYAIALVTGALLPYYVVDFAKDFLVGDEA